MVFNALKGGNQLDSNMIAIIVLLVIIVVMIIILSCILAKPVKNNSTCPNKNIVENYSKMSLKDQIESLKKIKAEGFKSIASQNEQTTASHEKLEKQEKIEKQEKYMKMTPKAKKLAKKYK